MKHCKKYCLLYPPKMFGYIWILICYLKYLKSIKMSVLFYCTIISDLIGIWFMGFVVCSSFLALYLHLSYSCFHKAMVWIKSDAVLWWFISSVQGLQSRWMEKSSLFSSIHSFVLYVWLNPKLCSPALWSSCSIDLLPHTFGCGLLKARSL